MDEDAAGRRRRGLIIAAVVFVVGTPLTVFTWLSERNAAERANDLAADVTASAERIDDLSTVIADEMVTMWEGGPEPDPLTQALGHEDELSGAAFGDDVVSVAFRTRWGLATRCVHVLIRPDDVHTEITEDDACGPRPVPG